MATEIVEGYLSNFSFRNNSNLRPAGLTISYTEEMVQELVRCKQDPIYFIKNYIKIVHVDNGLVPFELFPYQEKMIRAYHDNRRVLSMLFRQAGKCFCINTIVTVRSKITKEEMNITVGDLYAVQKTINDELLQVETLRSL